LLGNGCSINLLRIVRHLTHAKFGATAVADQHGVGFNRMQLVNGLAVRADDTHGGMLACVVAFVSSRMANSCDADG
ncbi:MAG: hypothetical protein COY36_10920, partial [Zetaproteobacteria bacterium CG_4_10_14_0_2_um_filter_55_20]